MVDKDNSISRVNSIVLIEEKTQKQYCLSIENNDIVLSEIIMDKNGIKSQIIRQRLTGTPDEDGSIIVEIKRREKDG